MSTIQLEAPFTATLRRHRSLAGLLELLMRRCELSPDALKRVRAHYEEKTQQLQGCTWLRQYPLHLSPHGSVALGTTVAPLERKHGEHDVDLMLKLIAPSGSFDAAELHRRVGARLRVGFASVLSPIRFGWTLDYSELERFHFDVVAAIPWLHRCGRAMAAAADTRTNDWKPTNPDGFAKEYLALAAVLPVIEDDDDYALLNERRMVCNSAPVTVVGLPEDTLLKTPLQRTTQLAKRFRDVWFSRRHRLKQRTPSIILTTLLWRAYERYVVGHTFPSMFRVIQTLADHLDDPETLRVHEDKDGRHYALFNPTVPDENLVARWNEPDRRGEADEFFAWVKDFRHFLRTLEGTEGYHRLEPLLIESLGKGDVSPVFREITAALTPSPARTPLYHRAGIGLTTAAASVIAAPVRAHTFDGHHD